MATDNAAAYVIAILKFRFSVMTCLFKQDELLVESEKINGENGCVGEKDGCIS